MQNISRFRLLFLLLSLVATLMIIFVVQCTDNSVNTTNTPSVDLSFKLSSPELSQMITSLRIVIYADDQVIIDDTVQVYEDQGYIFSDTLEVPVGSDRLFVVEALDATGNVLYRGEQLADVTSGIAITVQVTLDPQVSLLKLQPRFVEIDEGKAFTVDARIFNVKNLFDLTFRVYYDSTLLRYDSAVLSSGYNSGEMNFSATPIESNPSSVEIRMSHTDGTTLLVDTAGNATLAGFRFVARNIVSVMDSTYLQIDTVSMYASDEENPVVIEKPFIFDSCLVQIAEDTNWVPDTIPNIVQLLSPSDQATDVDTNILLTWQASDRATLYELAMSNNSFVWTTIATGLDSTSFLLEGLNFATTYYWRVQAHNNYGSADWSESWQFTTMPMPVDSISPAAIEDFLIADTAGTAVLLTWTAPGDDGNIGTADQYYVGSATSYSTLLEWTEVLLIPDVPIPQVAGTPESLWVTDLSRGFWYYFAIKSSDTAGNVSPISNIDSIYIPASITIVSFDVDYDSMGVGWKADWDDTHIAFRWSTTGYTGGPISYRIYVRDNNVNTDFIAIADVEHKGYLQYQIAKVTLPNQFDSDLSDAIQTPFSDSTVIEFTIAPYTSGGEGPLFTPYLSLSDSTPPVFEVAHTYGDADNIRGTSSLDDSISLDRTLEFCQKTNNPIFTFIEAGSDENYKLPETSINWTWNRDHSKDSAAYIRVPEGACGAGDLLAITIYDNSGNAGYDTLRLLPYINVTNPNAATSGFEAPQGDISWTFEYPAGTQYGSLLNYYLSLDNGVTFIDTVYEFTVNTIGSKVISLDDTLFSSQARIGLQNMSGGCIWLSEPFTLGGIRLTGPDTMVWAYEIAYDRGGTDSTAIPITWNSAGIENVKIWWRENTASSGLSYTSASIPNTGAYDFYPRNLGFNYNVQVGVMDADADGRPLDTLGWSISVMHDAITPDFPEGEDFLIGGQDTTISWTPSGSLSSNVLLQYSRDNGVNWSDIAITANDGAYRWAVPQNIPSYQFQIRFRDVHDLNTLAQINWLAMDGVEVLEPNGGEEWLVGDTQTIKWVVIDASGEDYLYLFYSLDNWVSDTQLIATGVVNDGSYFWTIPNTPTENASVLVYKPGSAAYAEPGIFDTSDSVFTIAGFTVNSPNGGETLEVGSNAEIKWETTGSIEAVDIYFGIEGWETIVLGVANTGSYTWVVPDYAGWEGWIMVTQASNTACNDLSDSWLSIAKLTVTSPTKNDIWYLDHEYYITWTSDGWEGSFKVELSTDAGANWETIDANVPSTSFLWYIPYTVPLSHECVIRVTTSDGALVAESDEYFEIQ
ncbi:MAG: hypothetical protein DRP47_00315 [Candidatus Zixiibacteriota bacterium]|nr:MAG: hypothetical protein DRP47_00315 [candidate division Zixibacteria bacterium]